MFLSRIIAEALGLGEERYEVFRKGDNVVFHFFVPVEVGVVSVEVMSRTHLGKISETPLFNEVVFVKRDCVECWTLNLEAYAVLQATRPDGPRDVDVARFRLVKDRVDWERARRVASELGFEINLKPFTDVCMILIVKYVETGDPTFLERVAREALRSGAFLEHVLDLILITPVEKLPPSARRLAAGVKHLVSTADCSSLPQRLAAPCEIAKRRLDFIKVEGEEVPEVEALGVDRVIYAFCKATGTIVV